MPTPDPIILLTRPAKQATRFRELLGNGVDVIESPVIEIRHLPVTIGLENYSALIFADN